MPIELIKCKDCGGDFAFTEGEQIFYQDKGFDPPKRCKPCRDKKQRKRDAKETTQRRSMANLGQG